MPSTTTTHGSRTPASPQQTSKNKINNMKKWPYIVLIFTITALAITLMVVPSKLMNAPIPGAALDLDTTFATLSGKGWLSLVLILLGFLLMIFDIAGADLVMNGVLTLMVLFKIVSVKDALAGFGNSGLITVVILFIVAQAITSTGGADWLVTKLLGSPSDTMLAQVRMCLITAVFSSFVNDTPVFCIMLPIVLSWAAKTRINIRQLLIPLSYCCLLGGLNTSIGTSTNLVVTGQFYSKILNPGSEYFQPGLSPISLFGVTPYGIPNVIWGIIYILYASPFLLTGGAGLRVFSRVTRTFKRVTSDGDDASLFDYGTDFIFGLLVSPTSPAIGKTVQDAHLRHLEGVYLASVRRNGRMNHAVGSEFVIAVGDVLYFSGIPDGVDQLATKHGLLPLSDATETLDTSDLPNLQAAFGVARIAVPRADSTRNLTDYDSNANVPIVGASGLELIQATINKGSDVIGRTIRDCAFRSRFHAAVVSIKRNGMPLPWTGPTIGDEVLRAGDQLLLDVGPQFWTTPDVNSTFQDIGKSGQVRAHNEFMLPMRVTRTLAGASVQKAGLRQLPNAFLVAIERGSTTLHAVSPEEILEVGDVAWFAGNAASVRFIRNTPGLVPLAERQARRLHNVQHVERRLVQAIIDRESPLVGRTPAEVQFRQQFNAAVVAVARKGERVRSKPSEVVIQASDILLLDAGPAFAQQHKDSKYFSILIEMEQTNPPRYLHTAICIALVATAFVLYALNVLDIVVGAAVAAGAMLITGCLSGEQARQSIRWDVYLMIAGSFGVSAGMEQSGGAAAIANLIVTIGKNAGGSGFVIAAIYMATMLLSQIISNNSAAALLFPIAATISKNDGIDIYILSYAVMLGASSVFMSSFGYQTNLMAMAAGGHSSRDFLKFGTPMQVVLAVVSIASLIAGNSKWPFVWLVTGVAGGVLLSLPQIADLLRRFKAKVKV